MLTVAFLSTLLMLGGLGGAAAAAAAAASDLQVYGKSNHSDKTLLSSGDGRHAVSKQPHQQAKSEFRRSLDLESFKVHMTPTTSKLSLPTITKLYPPTAKPLHLHANMPMRFGRENSDGDDRAPNSTPNMPQRFGRSWEVFQTCVECPGVQEAAKPPQRNNLYWSLLRVLANTRLLNTDLHWTGHFDLTASSEKVEMQEKTFK